MEFRWRLRGIMISQIYIYKEWIGEYFKLNSRLTVKSFWIINEEFMM